MLFLHTCKIYHVWGGKNCITHNPPSQQKFCSFSAALTDQPFSVSPQAHASIYPGHAGASLSAVSGGGGSDFLSISRKRRCQSEEREPRAASRQLSRLPLCVTGSWKRSCGSSCSLADEKAAEVRKSQQTGRSHRYKGKYGKSVFHFCRSNYIAVVSWRLLSLFTSFYHLK